MPTYKRYSSTVKPVDSTIRLTGQIPVLSPTNCVTLDKWLGHTVPQFFHLYYGNDKTNKQTNNNLRQSSVIKSELIHAKILESLSLMIGIVNIQSLAYYSPMQDKLVPLPFLVRCCCQKFLLHTKPRLSSLKFPLIYPKPNRKDRAE